MKAHRHYEDEGHVFVDSDGSRYICSQGYSQFLDKLPKGQPCPDCEAEESRRKGERREAH